MFVHWPGDGGTKKKYKNTKNRGQASADIIKRYLICLPVWFNDVRYQGQANNLAADKHNKFSGLENMHACTGVHQTLSFNPLLLKLANRSRFMSVLDHRFVRLFFFFSMTSETKNSPVSLPPDIFTGSCSNKGMFRHNSLYAKIYLEI